MLESITCTMHDVPFTNNKGGRIMKISRYLMCIFFLGAAIWLLVTPLGALAQEPKSQFTVYGFAMLDMGYDAKQNDPSWFDVVRPTKLPAFKDQFGKDGRTYASARQSRLGVKGNVPTALGDLKTIFEFEMFGVGVDAGQTTIRLRHAYGEIGQFGAGQYWSPFMDIDVFPNSVEYWGPSGMAFFRNVQVRWMPIQGDTRMTIALERPGASADAGIYADRIPSDITARFPAPDLSAEYRLGRPWGYIEMAGIVRTMNWDDNAVGWGLNLSSNIKISKDVVRLQVVYGQGIENYMNEGPADLGIDSTVGTPASGKGKALPVLGIVAFLDHIWDEKFSSSIGYSRVDITTSNGQSADAFKLGQYALANLMYTPVPNVMAGFELQWGQRQNNTDGWKVDDYRIQFSAKFNFSQTIGG
jgi:hypothetical protein